MKVLYIISEENANTNPGIKSSIYDDDGPVNYSSATMSQSLCEEPTNIYPIRLCLFIDQCLANPPSEKLHFLVDENKFRDHNYTMCRERES